ncbi:MAG: hypothetical protein DRN25_02375 [Thermoplasmata archaeon]|nr:MAG: hypothetical protein DRN25_02375 [Thermoplasmata archaeon]
MTLINTGVGMVQMCKNPWKRKGVYFRGRLAPWIGDPSKLSEDQIKRVKALTKTMVDVCTGVSGIENGVSKAALCLQENVPGRLTVEERRAKYKERLEARRKGKSSIWYS